MNSNEIRERFLKYFTDKGHKKFKSDSLIPSGDPTLLFTSAGMVQFKDYFLGLKTIKEGRACTSQKCFRTTDIEKIGITSRHHTFFEMLGNFSFGNYFKKEAIEWGWDFLTKEMKLAPERLYGTVYKEDNEAFELWKKYLPDSRIIRLGEDSNFWSMGKTGPCGPCSEILYDMGEEFGCGTSTCAPGCDCDRYLEVWNLVFTEFNRNEDGSLTPLPSKNIDTGMGLERLNRVVNGVKSNYDTDLFMPIIQKISEYSGVEYGENLKDNISIRIIADHIKGISFLIADGILPSNLGRGYILRRIIRRALQHEKKLGLKKSILEKLVSEVQNIYGKTYPELIEKNEDIIKILKFENEKFFENLDKGLEFVNIEIEKVISGNGKMLPGETVFKLYDTFGFPPDMLKELTEEKGLRFDMEGFEKLLADYKDKSRATWQSNGNLQILKNILLENKSHIKSTEFAGYEEHEINSRIIKIIKTNNFVNELTEGEEGIILLDKTVFYPEQGGQIGDKGIFENIVSGAVADVFDTNKESDTILHFVRIKKGKFSVNDEISGKIDIERRKKIQRNHTATHLLQAALRKYFGKDITQSGSYVADDRFRFDFTFYSKLQEEDIRKIEIDVNKNILENIPVLTKILPIDEAKKMGAMALFSEKYTDNVRVVMINKNDFEKNDSAISIELCGGTHTRFTGDIGVFKILSISSISANNKRIEGVTGIGVFDFIFELEDSIEEIANALKTGKSKESIISSIRKNEQNKKELKDETEKYKKMLLSAQKNIQKNEKMLLINNTQFVIYYNEGFKHNDLRSVGDDYKKNIKGVFILIGDLEGKKYTTIMTSKDIVKNNLDSNKILKYLVSKFGGSGGGNPELAQGILGIDKPENILNQKETNILEMVGKELENYVKLGK